MVVLLACAAGCATQDNRGAVVTQESSLRVTDSLCTGADHCGVVATQDDVLVVGMPWAEGRRGAVLVYRRTTTGWILQTRLSPSEGGAGEFGSAVATEDGVIFVGEPKTDRGRVWVFSAAGPVTTVTTLLPDDQGQQDREFGAALAVADGLLAVGAPATAGAAYVFIGAGDGSWTREVRVMGGHADAAHDRFGAAVAVDGDRFMVGAPGDSGAEKNAGAAYAFERRGDIWEESAHLHAAVPEANAAFGSALALRDDLLLVGAPGGAGTAHVFSMDLAVWTEHARLASTDGPVGFGTSVAIGDGYIAVGAPGEGEEDPSAVFTYAGAADASWTGTMMANPEGGPGSRFGHYLATDGPTLAIGAPGLRDDSGVFVVEM